MCKKIILFHIFALIGISCFSLDLSTLVLLENQKDQPNYDGSGEEDSDISSQEKLDYQLILAIAQKKYDLDFIDQLLFDGANPNYQHVMYSPISRRRFLAAPGQLAGMTPLGVLSREATFTQEMKKVADLLIDYGAQINKQCAALYPPLGFAIKNRNFDFAHYALSNGADPYEIKSIESLIADLQKVSWRNPQETFKLISYLQDLTREKPITPPKASRMAEYESHAIKMTEISSGFEASPENHLTAPINSDSEICNMWEYAENNYLIAPIPERLTSSGTEVNSDYSLHSVTSQEHYPPHLIRPFNSFSRTLINYVGTSH